MGSKNNPGDFDCWDKAEPDEERPCWWDPADERPFPEWRTADVEHANAPKGEA